MYNIVDKYWGREDWIMVTEHYMMKLLNVASHRILLNHYHEVKEETFYIISGEGVLKKNGEIINLRPGVIVHIPPGTRHQIEAFDENLVIMETSTPFQEDSIREEIEEKCL